MLISVIVPTYNRASYLPEAAASLTAQTIPVSQMEVIVIDDGSDDGTEDTVRELSEEYPGMQIRYIYQTHKGISAARNRGIREAAGEWIGFLDSDDLWQPDKAEKQLAYLDAHPEALIVFTRYRNFTDTLSGELSRQQKYIMEERMDLYLASALVSRRLFEKSGLFSESLYVGEDTEWVTRNRILHENMDHVIEEPLYLRRVHESNISLGCRENEAARYKGIVVTALHMAALARNRLKKEQAGGKGESDL